MFNFALSLNKFREPNSSRQPMPLANKIAKSMRMRPLTQKAKESVLDTIEQKQAPDFGPFMQMSQDFMIVCNDEGTIAYANDALYDALKIADAAQKTSLRFVSIFHEQDRPYIRNTIQTMALSAGEMETPVMDFEARLAGGDRSYLWNVREHNGNTYCTGRDITETKENTETIAQSEQQLVQAESIGRFGRWEWTIGRESFSWSDELYRIFGQDVGGFNPTMDNVYAMIHEDDQDRMEQTFQRAVINQNAFDIDFCVQLPNGEERYLRCEGRCRMDEANDDITLYGIMQDMSERIIYERELRSAKEDAEKACAARTQFLANMSHELRTPLNAIIGFSEMIEGQMLGPAGNDKYPEYGGLIRQSGAHLLDLIGDILDMAKIEAGKYDLDKEDVKLNDIISSAVTMMQPRLDENKLKFNQTSTFSDDLMLNVDRRACMQILLNIMSNAVKFTPEGGDVTLECQQHNRSVTMKIIDSGIGIPATKLASITDPFEQVSSHYTRDHEGTGLGLAITQELIELHGGHMQIKSQIDVGTQVTLTFPL